MEYTYTEIKNEKGDVLGILRNEDMAVIPLDSSNADYRTYLESLKA